MKNIAKLTAILIYLFIMSYLLSFELSQLFDLKQLFLVVTGMFILFLPGYRHGEGMRAYAQQLARCAIFASYIQTFILLFVVMSTSFTLEELPREAALSCRPLLYGICLWVILSNEGKETVHQSESKPNNDSIHSTVSIQTDTAYPQPRDDYKENKALTSPQAYEICRELGLTNREAELALQICKGLSNAEIAAELNISETTVKKHISNIFDKLGINKREQLLQCLDKNRLTIRIPHVRL